MKYAHEEGQSTAEELLYEIFKTVSTINPSKFAVDYWLTINKVILSHSKIIEEIWQEEKVAATESIAIAKEEALTFLASQREKIMRMSHQEALEELVKVHKIENKIRIINSIADNGLFAIK